MVGASGAIYGVMAAAAFFFPNAKLFIIPIPFPIKLKYLVGFYTLVEMYLGITSIDGVAHFAHLGGILVGAVILFIWKMQEKQRRQQGGVTAADEKVTDIKALYTAEQLTGDGMVVRRGKKTYKKVVLK